MPSVIIPDEIAEDPPKTKHLYTVLAYDGPLTRRELAATGHYATDNLDYALRNLKAADLVWSKTLGNGQVQYGLTDTGKFSERAGFKA